MPAPKSTEKTQAWKSISKDAASHNENNDCAVRMIALTTGTDYSRVHALCKAAGRKDGDGTHWYIIDRVMKALGFKFLEIDREVFISQYGGNHSRVLKTVTNHHPERFNKVWRDGNTYCLDNASHVAACINGEVHDWSKGHAKQCKRVLQVVPVDYVDARVEFAVHARGIDSNGYTCGQSHVVKAASAEQAETIVRGEYRRSKWYVECDILDVKLVQK